MQCEITVDCIKLCSSLENKITPHRLSFRRWPPSDRVSLGASVVACGSIRFVQHPNGEIPFSELCTRNSKESMQYTPTLTIQIKTTTSTTAATTRVTTKTKMTTKYQQLLKEKGSIS